MAYSVYILFSTLLNRYYIGHTHDLLQRVEQHNAGGTPSAKPERQWVLYIFVLALPPHFDRFFTVIPTH